MNDEEEVDSLLREVAIMLALSEEAKAGSSCPDASRHWDHATGAAEFGVNDREHVDDCNRCLRYLATVQDALRVDRGRTPPKRRTNWPAFVAVAASIAIWIVLLQSFRSFAGDAARERRQLQDDLNVVQTLQTTKGIESEILGLLEGCRNVLARANSDRRQAIRPLLDEAIARRQELKQRQPNTDFIDAEIRSVFAASLAFPTVELEKAHTIKLVREEESVFVTHSTAMRSDGSGVAVGTRSRPRFWKPGVGPDWLTKLRGEDFGTADKSPRIAYVADDMFVAFAPAAGGLTLWDSQCERPLHELLPDGSPVLAVGYRRERDSGRLFALRADGTIPTWTIVGNSVTPTGEWKLERATAPVTTGAITADGRAVAVADITGTVAIFGEDGKKRQSFLCGQAVEALAWSPDGDAVAVGLRSGHAMVVGIDGVVRFRVAAHLFGTAYQLRFGGNGYLFTGALHQGGAVFDSVSGEKIGTLPFGIHSVSKDGDVVAGASSMTLTVAKFTPPSAIRHIGAAGNDIARISWADAAKRRVVTLDSAFGITVLNVDASSPVLLRVREQPNIGDYATAADVCLNPAGTRVAFVRGGWRDNYFVVRSVASGAEEGRWSLPGGHCRIAATGLDTFVCVSEEVDTESLGSRRLKTMVREYKVGQTKSIYEDLLRPPQESDVHMFTHHWLSADGRYYAWGGPRKFAPGGGRRVEVFDVVNRRPVAPAIPVECDDGGAPTVLLDSDGKRLWFNPANQKSAFIDLASAAKRTPVNDFPFAVEPKIAYAVYAKSRGAGMYHLVVTRPDGRPWINLAHVDFTAPRGEGHPFSRDGRVILFGSPCGACTIVRLDRLTEQLVEIEKRLSDTR